MNHPKIHQSDNCSPTWRMAPAGRSFAHLALLGGLLLSLTGCNSLMPLADDDDIDDHDLQVELGTAAESPADIYVNMAAAYLQRGQIDAALTRAKRGVREDRNSARAHYMLAIVYQQIGENELAEKEFHKAVKLESRNPDYRNAWGVVLCKQKRYDDADEQFQEAAKKPLYATPEVALTNAADCALRAGNPTDAERYLRQALEKKPTYGRALQNLAELSLDQGDANTARELMGRYSRVAQPTPAALLLATRIEIALGNKKEAKMLATAMRKRFPDAPEIMELDRTELAP